MLELLKLLVQPVILERDADGAITGEQLGEMTPLYSSEDVLRFYAALGEQIAVANANGGGDGEGQEGDGLQDGSVPDREAAGDLEG